MSDNRTTSQLIAQRSAYYSTTLFNLQQLIISVEDRRGCKWFNSDDDNSVHKILEYLSRAELCISRRYRDVLEERNDDLLHRLETEHDYD